MSKMSSNPYERIFNFAQQVNKNGHTYYESFNFLIQSNKEENGEIIEVQINVIFDINSYLENSNRQLIPLTIKYPNIPNDISRAAKEFSTLINYDSL